LTSDEKAVWESFRQVTQNFLGNKTTNYVQIIEELIANYEKIGANMSLKIHFLHSHLDFCHPI